MLGKKSRFQLSLIAALTINIALILARIIISGGYEYLFLGWNLFLACIPLYISHKFILTARFFDFKTILFLILWLLFLPNAPYIITDLAHLEHKEHVPLWFDLLLLLLSAVNGMLLGFVSIRQVETYIRKLPVKKYRFLILSLIFLSTGYGVYIGRYLRLNSWDIVIKPVYCMKSIFQSVQFGTMCFVFLFSTIIFLFYLLLLRSLPHSHSQEAS